MQSNKQNGGNIVPKWPKFESDQRMQRDIQPT